MDSKSERDRLTLVLCLLVCLAPSLAHAQIKEVKDGVEHWYYTASANGDSYLSNLFGQIFNVVFTPKSVRPFGKSVAFLAGVSRYQHLSPQLPSVHNDILQMRNFLLKEAHFDEVYVAEDEVVNRDLIESYIKGILPDKMQKNDRLLFYYSGHGGDNHGGTGYMLFTGAEKGKFYGKDVLPVDLLKDWSQEVPVQHVLFILDSCSSGLGIVPKGNQDSEVMLLQTLSGNGSRTVLTAGTANEETYAEDARQQTGNSFFTKALLNAFESRSLGNQKTGFITVADLFAGVQTEMAKFRVQYGKATTPRYATLQEQDYRGTFVFLNPRATSASLTDEQVEAMGVRVVAKGTEPATEVGAGIFDVYSGAAGTLFVDGEDRGRIAAGETREFIRQPAGKHHLEVRGAQPEEKDITVESGGIVYTSFGQKSPIDPSGRSPVGSLEVESTHELSGDVFIDDVLVGRLEKNGRLHVENITVGMHKYRIIAATQVENKDVEIKRSQTSYEIAAPTGLTATVH